jgi:hypothetical protein
VGFGPSNYQCGYVRAGLNGFVTLNLRGETLRFATALRPALRGEVLLAFGPI